jgi:uncharacterized membrane protein
MNGKKEEWGDEQMRYIMGTLLRIGVLTSAFVVFIGAILFFVEHPGETMDFTVFKSEPARLRHVHTIVLEALQLRGRSLIQLGLLLLIATPVARVLFSLIGFLIEKDRIYIFITSVVLAILCCSMFSSYFTF